MTATKTPTTSPVLLALALTFPALAAGLYFIALDGSSGAPVAYLLAKVVQFSLPLLALAALLASRPRRRWSLQQSLFWGIGTGLVLTLSTAITYPLLLDDTSFSRDLAGRILDKMTDFAVDRPARYIAMAMALSILHSALEEYYWRWFVYGGLRRRWAMAPALAVSSVGFAAHHVIIIYAFLGADAPLWLFAVASLSVAIAGAVWAWLYETSGWLLAPWISHLLADLALMGLGYWVVWG